MTGKHGVVLMTGTDPAMRGGVAAVVTVLRDGGLFEKANVRYLASHVEGGWLRKSVHFAVALFRVVCVLLTEKVTVVHAHVSCNGSFWRKFLLLGIARCLRVPTVAHLHDGGFSDYASHGSGGALLRWCIRNMLTASDLVVVLSERWAAWVKAFAPDSRVRVVGNPVHVPSAFPYAKHAGSGEGGRVLYLGMICDAKGSFDLLDAWVQFRERIPGWRLVVGGNGDVDRFLAEAERQGVRDDIDYLGWISGPDKQRELSMADVFVLPSYKEGMPVSLLEAMAFGAAVVTTPVGGVPDMMLPDVHGLWTPPGDVGALATRLEQLAADPERRAALAAAARTHVLANFSVDVVVGRWCALYEEAVAVFEGRATRAA